MKPQICIALLALASCAPAIPESGATVGGAPVDIGTGVGFDEYYSYLDDRAAREAELTTGTSNALPATAPPGISADELAAAGLPSGSTISGSTRTVDANNPGISDEQDFGAVSSRESIQSDAERLAAQRDAYRVIQPTAVPTRSGSSSPNIVAYALNTTNRVGEQIYSRSGFNAESKFLRACADYPSPDLAQEAFLRDGGPQKDRHGMDPDGDGFACGWDPSPFRLVRG